MILIKDNVERVVDSKEKAEALKKKGYVVLGPFDSDNFKAAEAKAEKAIESMTVKELRALAKKSGIAGASALTKAELIELLGE